MNLRRRGYLQESVGIVKKSQIDRNKSYTVWEKHPYMDTWMIDRSYYGIYFYGEGEAYLKSKKHIVVPRGVDPNREDK